MFEFGRELKRLFGAEALNAPRDGLTGGDASLLELLDLRMIADEGRAADIAAGHAEVEHFPALARLAEHLLELADERVILVDGKAVATRVKLGVRRAAQVEIVDGLAAGDLIVTAGQLKLRDGAAVRAIGEGAPAAPALAPAGKDGMSGMAAEQPRPAEAK